MATLAEGARAANVARESHIGPLEEVPTRDGRAARDRPKLEPILSSLTASAQLDHFLVLRLPYILCVFNLSCRPENSIINYHYVFFISILNNYSNNTKCLIEHFSLQIYVVTSVCFVQADHNIQKIKYIYIIYACVIIILNHMI